MTNLVYLAIMSVTQGVWRMLDFDPKKQNLTNGWIVSLMGVNNV